MAYRARSRPSFFPPTTGETFVLYMKQEHERDFDTWLALAKCWKIWDLEARGFHKKCAVLALFSGINDPLAPLPVLLPRQVILPPTPFPPMFFTVYGACRCTATSW